MVTISSTSMWVCDCKERNMAHDTALYILCTQRHITKHATLTLFRVPPYTNWCITHLPFLPRHNCRFLLPAGNHDHLYSTWYHLHILSRTARVGCSYPPVQPRNSTNTRVRPPHLHLFYSDQNILDGLPRWEQVVLWCYTTRLISHVT